jgi:ligand-binding sensor domain-containing protein
MVCFMKHYYCLLLSILSFSGYAQQLPNKKISVESIGINKELSQGMINCIWQDHFGFMWFGTMDGLNRYDGYKFQVFRHDPFDSSSISGNYITSIFEDSKGRLWIGTGLNGLNLFIPDQEKFIHFNVVSKPALTNNTVYSIQEDRYGGIWIATDSGLNKLTVRERKEISNVPGSRSLLPQKPVSFAIRHIPLTGPDNKELFTSHNYEPTFLISQSGVIWVSASQSILRITPLQSGLEKIETDHHFYDRIGKKKDDAGTAIVKIIEDTLNGLLCFKGQNFLVIKEENKSTTHLWSLGALDVNMARNQVVCDRGVLYERCGAGLICFDLLKRESYLLRSHNSEHDKIMLTPFSFYQDRSGIIWIGTGGYGLLKYNPRSQYLHQVSTNSVTWMSATPSGDVLVLTPELKYYRIKSAGHPEYYEDPAFYTDFIRQVKQFPDFALQDREGTFWFNVKGIRKYNPYTKSFKIIQEGGEPLFPLFLDHTDRLWYATRENFCLFDKKSGLVTSYRFPITKKAPSPYKFCQVIYQDANHVFWLGTTEGLFSFDELARRWKHYKNLPGDRSSLSNNIVFSICDDPQSPGKYLWAGTNGGGLNRLDIRTGRFAYTSLSQGLPNMVVYGILADDDKQLWISTNKGIACFNPQSDLPNADGHRMTSKKRFRYYYEENGLQSNEFNRNAYCKTKDGTLFFGGVNGFNYFNPREVTGNTVIPELAITDLKLSNKSVSFNVEQATDAKQTRVLSKPVFYSDTIILPYSSNMISFDFSILDYTAPENNVYEYKMRGFDKDWVHSGSNHLATYTNLDPGEYTFIVKGCNSYGVWNEKGRSIHLTILAPWYMTWWFRAVVLAAITALISLFFRYRMQKNLHRPYRFAGRLKYPGSISGCYCHQTRPL